MTIPARDRRIRRLGADDWAQLRALRIAALTDAPDAFGSALERELEFDESRWRERLSRPEPTFVLEDAGEAAGMVGAYCDPEGPSGEVDLVSMWVAPSARGTGAAGILIDAVITWAGDAGYHRVNLWVTGGNEPAYFRYVSHGFVPTGVRQSLPGRPWLQELRLAKELPD